MNLDKASATTTAEPLAPPEWTMEVHRQGCQFTADLKRSNVLICRLSVMRPESEETAARADLADAARRWIHEYVNRQRFG